MNLQIGLELNVTCIKILEKGCIVELEDQSTEFIHVSNISRSFVRYVEQFVTVGKQYIARCISGRARPIELQLVTNDMEPFGGLYITTNNSEGVPTVAAVPQANTVCSKPSTQRQPHTREVSAAKTQKEMSLDDMIAKCQADFNDKFKRKDSEFSYRGRTSRKRKRK